MIADVTGLDSILLKDNIEIKKNNKYKTKKNFLIEFDKENNIIIKINKDSYARILINNITNFLMGINNSNDKELKSLKLIKIHLNYEENCKKAISKYRIKDYIDEENIQNILCIELSPPKCKKEYEIKKEVSNSVKWGMFLESKNITEQEEILQKILKENEYKEIIEKIKNKYILKK